VKDARRDEFLHEPRKGATAMNSDPIGEFLKAVEAAAVNEADVYAEDAVLDATVPNWRLRAVGPEAIKAEYAQWFSDPVTFAALERIPVPGGELVIYEHEWVQDGVRHRGHHAHHLVVRDGKIASDTVWCGGKWPEPLLNEMAAAGATA
jgi:hypothetical protein